MGCHWWSSAGCPTSWFDAPFPLTGRCYTAGFSRKGGISCRYVVAARLALYAPRGRRVERRYFPEAAVREVVVNALVHRDHSIAGADVLLSVFDDRIEVQSPGSLRK